jgi:hypothetical protein
MSTLRTLAAVAALSVAAIAPTAASAAPYVPDVFTSSIRFCTPHYETKVVRHLIYSHRDIVAVYYVDARCNKRLVSYRIVAHYHLW